MESQTNTDQSCAYKLYRGVLVVLLMTRKDLLPREQKVAEDMELGAKREG